MHNHGRFLFRLCNLGIIKCFLGNFCFVNKAFFLLSNLLLLGEKKRTIEKRRKRCERENHWNNSWSIALWQFGPRRWRRLDGWAQIMHVASLFGVWAHLRCARLGKLARDQRRRNMRTRGRRIAVGWTRADLVMLPLPSSSRPHQLPYSLVNQDNLFKNKN